MPKTPALCTASEKPEFSLICAPNREMKSPQEVNIPLYQPRLLKGNARPSKPCSAVVSALNANWRQRATDSRGNILTARPRRDLVHKARVGARLAQFARAIGTATVLQITLRAAEDAINSRDQVSHTADVVPGNVGHVYCPVRRNGRDRVTQRVWSRNREKMGNYDTDDIVEDFTQLHFLSLLHGVRERHHRKSVSGIH